MKNGSHVAIGLCFVLLGAALLLDRLGLFDLARALHFWPVALVLIGLGMIVQAIRGRAGERNDFPVGAVLVLVLVGLFVSHAVDSRLGAAPTPSADQVRMSAIFSGRRAAVQDVFREAHLTSIMGGTVLDLRQATIPPGGSAVVDVFALMGGTVLHVPREWVVDVQSTAIMGGVRDERHESASPRGRRPQRNGRTADVEMSGDRDPRIGQRAPLSDLPARPELPELPELPDGSSPPLEASQPPIPPVDAIEREDPVETPGAAPRLVVRGVVMMGGLTIKP